MIIYVLQAVVKLGDFSVTHMFMELGAVVGEASANVAVLIIASFINFSFLKNYLYAINLGNSSGDPT